MKRRGRRELDPFSLSFLDCICCGFGAIILLLTLTKLGEPHAIEEARQDLSGRIARLERELYDIRGESQRLERDLEAAASSSPTSAREWHACKATCRASRVNGRPARSSRRCKTRSAAASWPPSRS